MSKDDRFLSELINTTPLEVLATGMLPEVPVGGVVFDSREVKEGDIFVALSGTNFDGHQYIENAVEKGAVAVIGSAELANSPVPYIRVPDTRAALAYLSAAFYGFPAREMGVIGVTGTDGKTTTSNYIYQILKHAGLSVGLISTVNAVIGDETVDTGFHVTTPEAPFVQRYLSRMVNAGLTHVVLEATSHGLAQHRVTACDFDIGVVTNITHEHLDYHGSYEAYFAAKASLFEQIASAPKKKNGIARLAILNRDDGSYERLKDIVNVQQVSYGFGEQQADIRAEQVHQTSQGLRFIAEGPGFRFPVNTTLMGYYNVSNCLAAIGVAIVGLGFPWQVVQEGITKLTGIGGRMERIDLGQDFLAIVDFAHTPNALKKALETARQLTAGRVIAVFGSAGLRDRAKRRMMSAVSIGLADITILTAEDPRTESLDDILDEMSLEAQSKGGVEGQTFWRVPDRGEAIRTAIEMANPGDLVISCGKGHEQSMCFGEVEYLWDDRTAMKAALAEYLGIDGPEMPYLPTQD